MGKVTLTKTSTGKLLAEKALVLSSYIKRYADSMDTK
jgi:hypothetical protein